ncbi:MAG: Flp family type IVb pilin [Solirubrobacteraceae bacterium]
MHIRTQLSERLRGDAGQTLAEYALLVTAIAIVVVVAALLFGVNVTGLFSSTAAHV